MLKAYINPYADMQEVEIKEKPLPLHLFSTGFTASGYGSRIPTSYMVKVNNKWRRVYCRIYSNSGTLFIGKSIKDGCIVRIDRE